MFAHETYDRELAFWPALATLLVAGLVSSFVSVLLSLIAGILLTCGIQHIAFDGQSCWFLSLFLLGFSSLMGAVNYLTTIIQMRAPGMTMFRLPMTIWAMFITAVLQAFALPVLTAAGFMQLADRLVQLEYARSRRSHQNTLRP